MAAVECAGPALPQYRKGAARAPYSAPQAPGRVATCIIWPCHEVVGAALQKVRESHVSPAAKLLFAFATLTASRSGEARLARWSEVDLEKRVWTVPAERMKAKREHRVPLATHTIQVLADAQRLADGSGLIFPSPTRPGPLGTNTLIRLCHDLRLGCTPHGMRSSFRTWCSETVAATRTGRAGSCPCQPQPRRGGLHALRPVRAAAGADGSLERLPRQPFRIDSQRTCCLVRK